MIEVMPNRELAYCLLRLARLQRESVDASFVLSVAGGLDKELELAGKITELVRLCKFQSFKWMKKLSASSVPALYLDSKGRMAIVRGMNGQGRWVTERWEEKSNSWLEEALEIPDGGRFAVIKFLVPETGAGIRDLVRQQFFANKKLIIATVFGGAAINVLALITSLYTMQIYDRVIPTGANQTLLVLTIGVLVAIAFELFGKLLRSKIYEVLVDDVDQTLAHAIYQRFLNVRMDQMPRSVGSLSSQMRGYEAIRSALLALTQHVMVDLPFALLFVAVIVLISGWLALIPLGFFILSLTLGFFFRKKVNRFAQSANEATNFRTGLLVESVEGAETIKAGQAGWRMLSRWSLITNQARSYEMAMRNIAEHSQYAIASAHQFSYVLVIASGALLIGTGSLSMGALIAASILSGRILSPVASIPNILVQSAHAKAAMVGLDALWSLESDHHGQERPVILEHLSGDYRLENVEMAFDGRKALVIPSLKIQSGEKIAILGPIGAGKTTLLRLLTGMYKPTSGSVFLDSVDLSQISKPSLAEEMAYVQQDGRLFSGTLRENLIMGVIDPGDKRIIEAATKSGLLGNVVSSHPQGFEQPIYEGGTGLSGGQRQLVNLTRAFLRKPKIWLLDEPTASMDRALESQVIAALDSQIADNHTLVLVTHKPELLSLVDRIIVVVGHQIIMDGPKQSVLRQLRESRKPNDNKVAENESA